MDRYDLSIFDYLKICVINSITYYSHSLFLQSDDNLTDKYDAGKIVREIAKMAGGNGGGKKNFAQAGGKDINKVDDALQKALEII